MRENFLQNKSSLMTHSLLIQTLFSKPLIMIPPKDPLVSNYRSTPWLIFGLWCPKKYYFPHSTVILRKYFKNIPLKSCNIARIFIKLLERFLKYCRNLAMSVQNIIDGIFLQYLIFHCNIPVMWELSSSFVCFSFK